MSKFIRNKINGDQSIVGDNNTQDNSKNVIVNNHFHGSTPQSGGSDSGGVIGILLMIGVGVLMLIWKFYTNIDFVFNLLTIVLLTSPILIILAIAILYFKNELEYDDLFHFVYSAVVTAVFYYIINYSADNISKEMVNLALNSDGLGFFNALSKYGKNVAYSNILTVILISISSFFNHLISLRKFAYSLANVNGKGFWYGLFNLLGFIKFNPTFIFIAFFTILIGINIKGVFFGN